VIRYVRRLWVVPAAGLLAASIFALTALAGLGGRSGNAVTYTAVAGENNVVTVSVSGGLLDIVDTAGAVPDGASPSPCTTISATEITCGAASSVTSVTVNTLDGNDSVAFGSSLSGALGGGANLTADGGTGNDTLENDSNVPSTLSGGADDDTLSGGSGNDTLNGGTGSNTADYSAAAAPVGASIAAGGTTSGGDGDGGTDTYIDIQNLTGSAQGDTLTGDDGANTINGGGGADTIDGGAGNDVLNGQNGSGDTIAGGAGDDTINGGTGSDDTVSYVGSISSSASDGVNVDLAASSANGIGSNDAGHDTLSGIENVAGSPFADSLTGDPGANVLTGGGGNDAFGWSGDSDTFDGGTGFNSADFSADPHGVTLDVNTVDFPQPIGGSDTLTIASIAGVSSIQNVTGSPQNDTIFGDAQPNTLSGGGGSDTISGRGENDVLSGGAGNDVLTGDAGDDVVDGGDGNDTVLGNAGSDTLAGGAGTNTVDYSEAAAAVDVNLRAGAAFSDGDGGSDTLTGFQNVTAPSVQGNVLQGDAGNNVLDSGGAGGDTVSFSGAANGVTVDLGAGTATGDGNDTLLGGFANVNGSGFGDTLTAAPGGSTLNGGSGDDTLNGAAGNDTLNGGSDDDTLNGDAGDDTLNGGSGDDTLAGGSDDGFTGDTIDGGNGIDTLDYSSAPSSVTVNLRTSGAQNTGGAGVDTIANVENLTGSSFGDTLTGNGDENVLQGRSGNDTLDGGAGDDALDGGTGSNTVSFASANGAGVSVNLRLARSAALPGGDAGTDTLANIENVSGSPQNDTFQGDAADNAFNGGGGSDTVSYASAPGPVVANLAAGAAAGDGSDTLTGISNLTGSNYSDTLTGDGGANTLSGGAGDDTLSGGAGNDTLTGGAGNDTLTGGAGSNAIDGGTGEDTADYSSANSVGAANLAAGTATALYSAGSANDTLASVEDVTGSPGNDVLAGDDGDNVLKGGAGDDLIRGGAGANTLNGGTGTDTLDYAAAPAGVTVSLAATGPQVNGDATDAVSGFENLNGSPFDDTLSGNAGANTIKGFDGNDSIDGGGGTDTIDAGTGNDSVFAKDGVLDHIVCGTGNDSASVDSIDDVAADCEVASLLGGPVVHTFQATGVGTTSATVNGSINPDGRAVTYQFNYGLTSGYGQHTTPVSLPAGHTEVQVSAVLTGLSPGSSYHYQLVVTDSLGNTISGDDQSFTTGSSLVGPLAVTLLPAAGGPPNTDAVLIGRVTTNGIPTTWYFEYGTTTAYGQQTAAHLLGATSTAVQVASAVDLNPPPKTTWHYRLVATNQAGTSFGADQSFTLPLKAPLGQTRLVRPLRRFAHLARRPD
jgi:Ca2+-binding RTX toxin-like protein